MDLLDGLNRLQYITGTDDFFNSGVLITAGMAADRLDFRDVGKGFSKHVEPGERINPTLLHMPSGSLSLPPHCHPGGEIAYVISGEYFDADMTGRPIRTYPVGSVVIYSAFSTHRPLSRDGARIFYVPLDGILFPSRSPEVQASDPEMLLGKMEAARAPEPALSYARGWLLRK
ncbi:MAG: cupin domain-containing protein [Nanoarchaeota archaeon]